MPPDRGPRPPAAYRWLLNLASRIAPPDARAEWLRRWNSRVRSWWILGERGELVGDASARPLHICGETVADAFWRRFSYVALGRWLSGPWFPLAAAAAVLLLLAAFSHGFAVTRSVFLDPNPQRDRVIAYGAPIVAAFAIGLVLAAVGRPALGRCGWRGAAFLLLKLAAAMAIVPLLWIEGGHGVRTAMPTVFLRQFVMGLMLAAAFVAAFCRAVAWCIADQRRRCPVCLHRFTVPVAMGSWGSVLDPAATEFLCDRGHGSLSIQETGAGGPDRWSAL